ncbi:Nuclear transcription factor Y subunit A-7 [Ranunculus cassubicifolius]
MPSSSHDQSSNSDSSESEEQQQQSESQIQPQSPAGGTIHPGVPPLSAEYMMPPQYEVGHAVAPAGYPYDPYYRSIFTPYGAQPMIHPHIMGIQAPAVPLPSDAVEEPVYVNAKQYHGILRRRQSRAKAELENKMLKNRKPYLHESRHLHALRRARGNGGRFLNAKPGDEENKGSSDDNSAPDTTTGKSHKKQKKSNSQKSAS